MNNNPVKIIFGGVAIGPGMGRHFPDEESIAKVYQLPEEGGCTTIDTGRLYPGSEEWMDDTICPIAENDSRSKSLTFGKALFHQNLSLGPEILLSQKSLAGVPGL
ncbi:hypothetical protein C8R45DRAFT_1084883 [Mycena sanguinolenta]|nr:hypothetical protein C8R45DRAFT_1084883 [Mycena sanguinolenta]